MRKVAHECCLKLFFLSYAKMNLVSLVGGGGAVPPLDDIDNMVADIIGMDASNVVGLKGYEDISWMEHAQQLRYVERVHSYDFSCVKCMLKIYSDFKFLGYHTFFTFPADIVLAHCYGELTLHVH